MLQLGWFMAPGRRNHVTPCCKDYTLLSVLERIEFKLCVLALSCSSWTLSYVLIRRIDARVWSQTATEIMLCLCDNSGGICDTTTHNRRPCLSCHSGTRLECIAARRCHCVVSAVFSTPNEDLPVLAILTVFLLLTFFVLFSHCNPVSKRFRVYHY